MTLQELLNLLDSTGYPVAYNHFNSTPSVPFIVYRIPSETGFDADNAVYHNISDVEIEVYTNRKDLTVEATIKNLLNENELPFVSFETFIESEKLFQKIYETRLI